jgi:tetratricopeptide (TPR) repeat protein
MHVMVQAWAQDRIAGDARERQALAARMVLIESMVISWNRHEMAWMRLIPAHVKACLAHKAAPVTHDPYQAILDYKLGWYYTEEKQFPEAIEHLSNALRIWKFEKGVHSEPATTVLLDLATVYHEMGRAGDAEHAYFEVLERLKLRVADMRTEDRERRARAKARLRRRARSEELARLLPRRRSEAKKVSEKGTGDDDSAEDEKAGGEQDQEDGAAATPDVPDFVPSTNATPSEEKVLAEQLIADVLSVVKKKPRQYTPDDLRFELASVHTGLARLDFDQGHFASGTNLVLKAMELMRQCEYPDDIRIWALEDELIRRFRKCGDIRHWGRRTSALSSFSEDAYEDVAAHEYSFVWRIGYACYLVNENSWEEAYRAYESIMELAPFDYGAGDRRTLYLMRKMAWCQLERGFFEEAEELARTAIERAKASYGQCHLHTAKCLDTLSMIILCQTLDVDTGSEFWSVTQEAYDSARTALSPDHYLTVRLKTRLDTFCSPKPKLNDLDDAAKEENNELFRTHKPKPINPSADGPGENDDFSAYIDKMFADGYPETREEYMTIVNAEYREYNRKKFRAQSEMKKQKKPSIKKPAVPEAVPSAQAVGSSQEAEEDSATAETPEPPRHEHKEMSKGKGKALSPLLKDEPDFSGEPAHLSSSSCMDEETTEEESWPDVKGKGKALPLHRSGAQLPFGEGTSKDA